MKTREELLKEKAALEAELKRQKLEREVKALRKKTGKQGLLESIGDLLSTKGNK